MQQQKHNYKYIIMLVLMLWGPTSFATGLGFSVGKAFEDWSDNYYNDYYNNTLNQGNRDVSNFGFVLDTTVAKNKLFNYRFSLLREENKADPSHVTHIDAKGISMTHDFGFGVLRTKYVRLWVGPQLKAAFYSDITQSQPQTGVTTDGNIWGFAFGPVIGVNVHLPEVVTFSFTAGYHLFGAYVGEYDYYSFNSYSGYEDVDVDTKGTFFNASLIFRINDKY